MSVSFLKKLAGVTGLLIALWVAYLYRQVPHQKTPFAKAAASVEQILLEQGGQKVQFSKRGGDWQVLSATGTLRPADEGRVKTFILNLRDLQIEDEISDRADRAADYQVDASSGLRVSFRDAQGHALAEGIFGKQAPDFTHSYFRYPDKPNVYLAHGLLPGDVGKVEPDYWLSREQKPPALKTK